MTRTLLALSLLAGACQTAPARGGSDLAFAPPSAPAASAVVDELPLAPAGGPLRFARRDGPTTLAEVVDAFAAVTGQNVVTTQSARQQMEATVVSVEAADVPAAEVYPFVEALLHESRFVLAPLKGGAQPVLGVYGPHDRNTVTPLHVAPEVAARLVDHPALIVRTVVPMRNSDVRTVQTQLRGLITDTTVQRMAAAGENAMVVEGIGSWVASTLAMLRDIDAASAVR